MKRREFIQSLATTATGYALLQAAHTTQLQAQPAGAASSIPGIEGHTLVSTFTLRGMEWKVYEDLRTRDGAFTFISARGDNRIMAKSAEAQFPDADPQHLGLSMDDI
jgi:hypothetical protein